MANAHSPGLGTFRALKERATLCLKYAEIHAGKATGPDEMANLPKERATLTLAELKAAEQVLTAIVERYNRETQSNISNYSLADFEKNFPVHARDNFWLEAMEITNQTIMWCDASITLVSGIELLPSSASINYWTISGDNNLIAATNTGQMVHQTGPSSTAMFNSGANATQSVTHNAITSDARDLYHLMSLLASAMTREAKSNEEVEAAKAVAEAAKEAENGNVNGALARLKAAGKWAGDIAEKIGVGVAVAALKSAMGL